ncbi:MAG: biotin/lipoyl-binding protein [Planctomycetota bacterium]
MGKTTFRFFEAGSLLPFSDFGQRRLRWFATSPVYLSNVRQQTMKQRTSNSNRLPRIRFSLATLLGLMFFGLMTILFWGIKFYESRSQWPVFAKEDGVVSEVLVQTGEVVEKGQVLAVLRSPSLELEVAQLAASGDSLHRDLLTQKTSQLQVRATQSGKLVSSASRLLNLPTMRGQHLFTIQGRPPFDSRKVLAVTAVGTLGFVAMFYRYRRRTK